VSFPSLQPSKSTAFKCYVAEGEEGEDFEKQRTTIAGETDTVEFTGSDMNEAGETGSRYGLSLLITPGKTHVKQSDTSLLFIDIPPAR
jgi:DNA-directed RNA polymerase I subunit RPA49